MKANYEGETTNPANEKVYIQDNRIKRANGTGF